MLKKIAMAYGITTVELINGAVYCILERIITISKENVEAPRYYPLQKVNSSGISHTKG